MAARSGIPSRAAISGRLFENMAAPKKALVRSQGGPGAGLPTRRAPPIFLTTSSHRTSWSSTWIWSICKVLQGSASKLWRMVSPCSALVSRFGQMAPGDVSPTLMESLLKQLAEGRHGRTPSWWARGRLVVMVVVR